MSKKSVLVVSAHAADFVWRAGGAIALHAEKGYEVTVGAIVKSGVWPIKRFPVIDLLFLSRHP